VTQCVCYGSIPKGACNCAGLSREHALWRVNDDRCDSGATVWACVCGKLVIDVVATNSGAQPNQLPNPSRTATSTSTCYRWQATSRPSQTAEAEAPSAIGQLVDDRCNPRSGIFNLPRPATATATAATATTAAA